MKYPMLFSPFTIKGVTFRNRIFATPVSPLFTTYDGALHPFSILYYEDRAKGGAASVTLTEHSVNRTHANRGANTFIDRMPEVQGYMAPADTLAKVAQAIRAHGAVPSIQLHHAGDQTSPQFIGGRNPIGPDSYKREDGVEVIGMDEALMEEVALDFERAARTAKECGFEMVQIHGAHGWLLAQFLSPLTNHRKDGFGGSLENRAKFPLKVIDAVRRGAGENILVEYRISGDERMEGGMEIDEVSEFCAMMEGKADIFHVSAGSYWSAPQYTFPTIYQPRGLNMELAAAVKKRTNTPVTSVGGYADGAMAERALSEGKADFIGMGRALIADPRLPKKLWHGFDKDVRPCVRCVNCLGRKYAGHHNCDVNPVTMNEFIYIRAQRIESRKKVMVVGGGPAGMSAAYTAAERGHDVCLVEKEEHLGGKLYLTRNDAHKADLMRFLLWQQRQLEKHGVRVKAGTLADAAFVKGQGPDALVCAVGAEPIPPPFPGLSKIKSANALEVYKDPRKAGETIVIAGGGLVGCEAAIFLAGQGRRVTIVEMREGLAPDSNRVHYSAVMEMIGRLGIEFLTETVCSEAREEGVAVRLKDGEERLLPADTLVVAVGMSPDRKTAEGLRAAFYSGSLPPAGEFFEIGDCVRPDTIRQAVHQGYMAGLDIL